MTDAGPCRGDAMRCCGESRKTPFCPECGKRMTAEAPLAGLLHFCRDLAAHQASWLEKAREDLANEPDARRAKRLRQAVAGAEESEARWTDWARLLAQLLAKNGITDTPTEVRT